MSSIRIPMPHDAEEKEKGKQPCPQNEKRKKKGGKGSHPSLAEEKSRPCHKKERKGGSTSTLPSSD